MERWQGRIIAVWMMIRQYMVYVICVYGPQTAMLCVAGDFNAHIGAVEPGDEET